MRLFILAVTTFVITISALAWEPSQEPARAIQLTYDLFDPFNLTEIDISIDAEGRMDHFSYSTAFGYTEISSEELKQFRYPSLADIEVMHFGEEDIESGLGGDFSICIPYGPLVRIDDGKSWQRATLSVLVTSTENYIGDIPLPDGNRSYVGSNGCEAAAIEVYGL